MALYNGHQEDSSGNILLSIGNGMTATLETGSTASQAYTKGAYIFFNNRLCKTTTAISSGNTLSIGTNLAQTSIGEEITSHLRATNGDEFYFDYKDGKAGYYPTASKTASEFVPFGGTGMKAAQGQLEVATTYSTFTTIDCGFRPSVIYCRIGTTYTGRALIRIYDSSYSTTVQIGAGSGGLSDTTITTSTSTSTSTTSGTDIKQITNTGFVLSGTKSNYTNYRYVNWFAIGE